VRRRLRGSPFVGRIGLWFPWLCAASLVPRLSASVTFPEINVIARVFIGLAPFCALLGFLTPALIDREAGDDPARAGEAYGINLLGCAIGSLVAGMTLSVLESFPYVRVFGSIYGVGYHVIASNDPIPNLRPEELVARMPEAAVSDMREWNDSPPASFFAKMLGKEYDVDGLLIGRSRAATLAITDDRPVNEFFLMRRLARGELKAPASEGQGAPVR